MASLTTPQAPFIAASESYLLSANPSLSESFPHLIPPTTLAKLRTVGLPRIKDMRAAGVATQIVSHLSIAASPPHCAKINDALNGAICLNPDRFSAMALLPAADGNEAALELQRCVLRYKFVGGVLGLGPDTRIDGDEFDALWAAAEKCRVPVAVREVWPSWEQARSFFPSLPESSLGPLVAGLYAAHASSPLPLVQLYAAGVFDRRPNLRLVVSRSGLTIATLLPRIEAAFQALPTGVRPRRRFLDVWEHNFFVSTEDVLDVGSMRMLLDKMPLDRVLYAANYPFEDRSKALMEELRESGVVGEEEWERIASGNAEMLFSLKGRVTPSKANIGRPLH